MKRSEAIQPWPAPVLDLCIRNIRRAGERHAQHGLHEYVGMGEICGIQYNCGILPAQFQGQGNKGVSGTACYLSSNVFRANEEEMSKSRIPSKGSRCIGFAPNSDLNDIWCVSASYQALPNRLSENAARPADLFRGLDHDCIASHESGDHGRKEIMESCTVVRRVVCDKQDLR